MKKTKFLMPILGIGATTAAVVPMATIAACSKPVFTLVKKTAEAQYSSYKGGPAVWKINKVGKTLGSMDVNHDDPYYVTSAKIGGNILNKTEIEKVHMDELEVTKIPTKNEQGEISVGFFGYDDIVQFSANDYINFKLNVQYKYGNTTNNGGLKNFTFKLKVVFVQD